MFQVVVKERFDIIGDENSVLGSEFLAPELEATCQAKIPRRRNLNPLTSVSLTTALIKVGVQSRTETVLNDVLWPRRSSLLFPAETSDAIPRVPISDLMFGIAMNSSKMPGGGVGAS